MVPGIKPPLASLLDQEDLVINTLRIAYMIAWYQFLT